MYLADLYTVYYEIHRVSMYLANSYNIFLMCVASVNRQFFPRVPAGFAGIVRQSFPGQQDGDLVDVFKTA